MSRPNQERPTTLLRSESGGLSITALWLLALLGLMAVGLSRHTLTGLRLNAYASHSAEATWLARAGVWHAVAILLEDAATDSSCDARTERWAHSPESFKQVSCGNGFFRVAWRPRTESPGQNRVYGVADENSRVNLSLSPPGLLLRLPGMTPQKVAALLDWRDPDQVPREGGAELPYYLALAQPYRCKDAALEFVEELALIRGFTADDVRRLRPLVTVHSNGRINLNTASTPVLQVVGLRPDLARRIVRWRRGADGEPFTADDRVFTKPSDIASLLKKRSMLKAEDENLLNSLVAQGLLGTSSTHFTIISTGVTMGGQVQRTVTATIRRVNQQRIQVLAWQEK